VGKRSYGKIDRKSADMLDRIKQLEIEYGNVGFLSFKKKKFINQQLEEQKGHIMSILNITNPIVFEYRLLYNMRQ
jgi:hypothetical protein